MQKLGGVDKSGRQSDRHSGRHSGRQPGGQADRLTWGRDHVGQPLLCQMADSLWSTSEAVLRAQMFRHAPWDIPGHLGKVLTEWHRSRHTKPPIHTTVVLYHWDDGMGFCHSRLTWYIGVSLISPHRPTIETQIMTRVHGFCPRQK